MWMIRFLQLLSLGLLMNADMCSSEAPPCDANWFGSPCRYRCHCDNGRCNNNGECAESSVCERGWFSPTCQYLDLVSTSTASSTPAWVYDLPDTQCNPGLDTVTVSLTDTFYFTWLRLGANAVVNSQDFTLQLRTANSTSVECSNMYTLTVNGRVLDFFCQPGAFFQELIITGNGVKSLCSVFISGGRNIALGQNTALTSVLSNHVSWHTVDGNTDPNLNHGSCAHTYLNDQTPTWTLTFDRPHLVDRYVLYNRDILQERLWGFILTAYHANKSVAFTYTDSTKTSKDIYRIMSTNPQVPVSSVTIVATYNETDDIFLALCEVEIFGDTVCPTGHWGRECKNTCHCLKDGDNCFVSSGGCPSNCAAGYQGEGCRAVSLVSTTFVTDGPSTEKDKVFSDESPDTSQLPIAAIVGSVVGFVVLVTLIVVGVIVCRRCRHTKDVPRQTTPHTFHNFAGLDNEQSLESEAVITKQHNAVTRQATPLDDNGYYNFTPPNNETPVSFHGRDNPSARHRGNDYQGQLNRDLSNNAARQVAPRLGQHHSDRHTPNNDMDVYAVNLNFKQLKSEASGPYDSYTDDTTDNPYEIVRDSMTNPYDEINDL